MLHKGSQMSLLWALGIVWLICGFPTVYESAVGANAASKNDCYRKTCKQMGDDIREVVCCENHLHKGTWLSCYGTKAFKENKDNITANITQGLSKTVSACCGLKAYNSLNEICCDSVVVAKPAPKARCCGNEVFDPDKQICCGPTHDKKILTRNSSHHQCCGHDQYNNRTHCCCLMENKLKIQPLNSCCCVEDSANITQGLSKTVSACCGLKAYNSLNEICCDSVVVAKPAPKARCCGNEVFDADKQICCGPTHDKKILTRNSSHHQCCGHDQYNNRTHCCCLMENKLKIQPLNSCCCVEDSANITQGLSKTVSACCGLKAYNSLNEICCDSVVVAKPAPKARCCGNEVFDADKQICCGPTHDKKILTRNSSHHQCCGHDQYNNRTHCCCLMENKLKIQPLNSCCCVEDSAQINVSTSCGLKDNNTLNMQCCGAKVFDADKQMCCGPTHDKKILTRNSSHHQCCGHDQYNNRTHCCCLMENKLKIQPLNSCCCVEDSGVQQQKPQPNCTSPCWSSCYNPNDLRCCERNQIKSQWCCASGRCDAAHTVYNPQTHVCCDGCVSERKPWIYQCGEVPYGLAEFGVLCCNNTLYKDREDGEQCSQISIPYNAAKGTICFSQLTDSSGQHCCGRELYQPDTEICCNGHRHLKVGNMHCCGVKAYNITDPQKKCCAGTLHNLTSIGQTGHDAQCCGSILQNPMSKDVCCSCEDKELLYTNKTGFRCCGHLYYNTSVWSCCAGKLSPVHQPGQHQSIINESKLLSLNNLNEKDLCKRMLTGTVESVSLHSILFSSVLEIYGRNGTVNPLRFRHILQKRDHCNFPQLIPGKTYFFDEVNFFNDFNHDTFLQSLHFIISKCYRR